MRTLIDSPDSFPVALSVVRPEEVGLGVAAFGFAFVVGAALVGLGAGFGGSGLGLGGAGAGVSTLLTGFAGSGVGSGAEGCGASRGASTTGLPRSAAAGAETRSIWKETKSIG